MLTTQPATSIIPPVVSRSTPRGLTAKWELVNGKLTCQWLKQPD